MSARVVLGAVLAGLAMFVWGALSHMVLGLTDRPMKSIPAEEAFVQVLRQSLPGPGLYLYPGLPPGFEKLSKAEQDAATKQVMDRAAASPHGIVVYAPAAEVMNPAQLGRQLAGDVAAAWLAAIVIAMAGLASYARRVLVVVLLGLFGACMLALPYANWYGFPADFTRMTFVDVALRSLSCGLVLGAIVRPTKR